MTPTEIQRQCDEIARLDKKAKEPNPHKQHLAFRAFEDASRTFAPAAAVALKVAIDALTKISNEMNKPVSEVSILALNASCKETSLALAAITHAFHE